MLNFKSLKWCIGIALSLGLSACMDMQRSERMDTRYPEQYGPHHKQEQKAMMEKKHMGRQKTYASKDPTQPATPGPARKGAPQLPVVQ